MQSKEAAGGRVAEVWDVKDRVPEAKAAAGKAAVVLGQPQRTLYAYARNADIRSLTSGVSHA